MTRLEQLRVDAGLTPEQLGSVVGVHGNTVRNIERGKSARPVTLTALADHFGIPASDLCRPALPPVNDRQAA